jgi:hypothetical protein
MEEKCIIDEYADDDTEKKKTKSGYLYKLSIESIKIFIDNYLAN